MSAHAKRLARARRRVALRGPVVYLARQVVIAAIKTLPDGHRLRRWAHDDPLLRIWELPDEQQTELLAAVDKLQGQITAVLQEAEPRLPPPWSLGEMAALFQTEVQVADVGQRRKAGRPPKPKNSNDEVIEPLKGQFPDLLTAPLPQSRMKELQRWLRRNRPELRRRSDETLARAIRRAQRPKQGPTRPP